MTVRLVSDASNVVPFPRPQPVRATIEAVAALAPSRSLVDTVRAERGLSAHDARTGFAREFAHQARALEAAHGRDGAIARLRGLVDELVEHAHEVCLAFRATADRVIALEVHTARDAAAPPAMRTRLDTARGELRDHVVAAGASTDAAVGAASALALYVREGVGSLPVCIEEPRQLLLFAAG